LERESMTSHSSELDQPTQAITDFATRLQYSDLPASVVHDTKRRIVDSLGGAIGGAQGAPVKILRELSAEHSFERGARIIGLKGRVTADMAAFTNGTAVRYLDFNDGFGSKNGSHPSDMIGGVLAIADAAGVSGERAILGVVAAYEANWSMPVNFMDLGWDQ